MAAIYIRGIPFSLGEVDFKRRLAGILHGPDFEQFSTGIPLNFDLFLIRSKNGGRGHSGQGVLTVPTYQIARQFVLLYGGGYRPNNGIMYAHSDKPARPDIVDLITNTPYQDPRALEERQKRTEKLQGELKLTSVQFGWRCRDDAFSVEWDSQEDETLGAQTGHSLVFNEDLREVRVMLARSEPHRIELWGLDVSLPTTVFVVAIKYSHIESISLESIRGQQPSLLLTFSSPPALETQSALLSTGFNRNGTKRDRVTSFSPSHHRIIPFASLALRLQCQSSADIDQFFVKAKEVHLPHYQTIFTPPVQRRLFHETILNVVQGWIAGLEWQIAFQCTAILNEMLIDPKEMWGVRGAIETLHRQFGSFKTSEILRLFRARLKILSWEGTDDSGANTVGDCLTGAKEDTSPLHMALRDQSKDDSFFNCLHVTCTPTRFVLDGPFPDQSNRVLRRYPKHHECFLRVNFTDEEFLGFRWDRDVDGAAFVRERVGGVLKDGITIAGRHFEFLAYSSSALREHAVWFCKPFTDKNGHLVTAASIRASLGVFKKVIKCPARYGARLSQAFTATESSVTLATEELFPIPDIIRETPDGKESNFSDGIGTISRDLANEIAKAIERRPGNKKKFWYRPSAYQVRIGGHKGVLSVDYTLSESIVCVRPSMDKFDAADSLDIEIASAFFRPSPMYLNRPLIMILETLGVPIKNFVAYQDEAVEDIHGATESLDTCARFMDAHGCGMAYRLSSVFLSLHKLHVGIVPGKASRTLSSPFLDRSIEFAANHALRELKHKARIPIKGSHTLVGVVDEHGYLEPDDIFVCIRHKGSKPFYLEGKVVITRSPQVHPGDVQFVYAIGKPPPNSPFEQEEFPNCVVFSSKGERSVPSMLAGGDLDGDLYNVITDPALFPTKIVKPAAYDPAVLKTLDRDCTISDLADWVAEYINADILGFVSTQFLIMADQSPDMACDPRCIKLAELASAAVDFVKSGTPVRREDMPPLRYKARPDWSTGEMVNTNVRGSSYESKRAIGVLYRRINLSDAGRKAARASREAQKKEQERFKRSRKKVDPLVAAMANLTLSGPANLHDPISQALLPVLRPYIDIHSSIPKALTKVAAEQFSAYVAELRMICATSSLGEAPLSEEEVFVGTIATNTSQPKRRKDLIARMRNQSGELTKRIMLELAGKAEVSEDSHEDLEDWALRGWAAWHLAVSEEDNFGARSFGWIALAAIFEAVKAIEEKETGLWM